MQIPSLIEMRQAIQVSRESARTRIRTPNLEGATKPGGILYENPAGVTTARMRHHSKAWRTFIEYLGTLPYLDGCKLLETLGVERFPKGKATIYRMIL